MKSLYLSFALFCTLVSNILAQNVNVTLRSHITYGTQTCANICGYAADGHEYALVGGSLGMIIEEVTDPDNPIQIVQIPHINNLWKEIKVYQHYAYLTTEGNGGALQIIDMANLPSSELPYYTFTGEGAIAGQISTIHALHIDTTLGFLYLFGSNIGQGGALVFDIHTDPYNPVYVGEYNTEYIHDGYVDNDTLYAGHIYTGDFRVVDMTDKSNPVVLNSQLTPNTFTHNVWPTVDKNFLFTTDETEDSYLTAYDISDVGNIKETDRIQSNPGSNSIVHNTHIINNYAVTSWYRDGFTIVDVSRPHNMIQVGNYDNWDDVGGGFNGCWGVYPFLPSGTIVVSNIEDGLWVFSPTYIRGCYLEGVVTNANTTAPILGATVTIIGSTAASGTDQSNINGEYATGQVTPGTFDVTYSAPGYISQTLSATLVNGELVIQNVALVPVATYAAAISALTTDTNIPIAGAKVKVVGDQITYEGVTDANGNYNTPIVSGTYQVYVGKWGYKVNAANSNILVEGSVNIIAHLTPGYEDDFVLDLGWAKSAIGTTTGLWVRENPIGTTIQNNLANPENDIDTDLGDECYVTGNGGGAAGDDDIDNGSATLISPLMDMSGYADATLSYYTWFFNGGGQGTPNDDFKVSIENGQGTVVLETITEPSSTWRPQSVFNLAALTTLTSTMRVVFQAEDVPGGHVVEAAVDGFKVVFGDTLVGNNDLVLADLLTASPNPFSRETVVRYNLGTSNGQLAIIDLLGRTLRTTNIHGNGLISIGNDLTAGMYFVRIESADGRVSTLKIVKE